MSSRCWVPPNDAVYQAVAHLKLACSIRDLGAHPRIEIVGEVLPSHVAVRVGLQFLRTFSFL